MTWVKDVFSECHVFTRRVFHVFSGYHLDLEPRERVLRFWGMVFAIMSTLAAVGLVGHFSIRYTTPDVVEENQPVWTKDLSKPVRSEPARFRARSHMPKLREGKASGSIGAAAFMPKYDLVRVEDSRVWWESEHDENDTEDDHIMHRAIEEPFRRLIELMDQNDGTLKVQDAYRDEGIHARKSLHKEGRALDMTSDGMSLEKLAKLCWAAGFDWVYYESPKKGGAHVHASVRSARQEDH